MDEQQLPWWSDAVVYQIYPRSFADANGDGVGDLPGIIAHLDHVADLGVDVVVNHTSDQHRWFIDSASGPTSERRDWYIWRPPRDGMVGGAPGAEPTNWGSFFGGPAWQFDRRSGEYYLHLFSAKQPDLNWENPALRSAVQDMLRWWLERGVDGFRLDVVNFLSKDQCFPDGHTPRGRRFGDGGPFFVCGPRIHEFLHELNVEVYQSAARPLLTVGEMPEVTVDEAIRFTDPAAAEVDMVFQFEHVGLDQGTHKFDVRPFDLRDLKATFGRWQAALARTGWNSLYWNNHDQPRVVSRFGDDGPFRVVSAKMLATVLHLHRGTPYIYQGEELGMTNAVFTGREDFRDIESLNYFDELAKTGVPDDDILPGLRAVSRDNARTPMQWTAGPQAGFTTGVPWLPVNRNHTVINAEAARTDPDSVLAHYRRLIVLRHSEKVVTFGDFLMLMPEDAAVYAFTRSWNGVTLLVLGNFTGGPASVQVPDWDGWQTAELIIGNYSAPTAEHRGQLRPWEARVYRRAE